MEKNKCTKDGQTDFEKLKNSGTDLTFLDYVYFFILSLLYYLPDVLILL